MLTDEWRAIKARIDGLATATHLVLAGHISNSSDTGMLRYIEREVKAIHGSLEQLIDQYGEELPLECKASILEHLDKGYERPYTSGNAPLQLAAAASPVIFLASQISYLLSDNKQAIRNLTERAFLHLQRTIAVQESARKEWTNAFSKGETACEGLGANHLLLFGILAFKINAAGARTDLVFQEPIKTSDVSRSAEGLVLTEWKVVKEEAETDRKAQEAIEQTKLYTDSALAGIELRNYRYIVLVSANQLLALPEDQIGDNVTYRHINIAINPLTPSQAARKRT